MRITGTSTEPAAPRIGKPAPIPRLPIQSLLRYCFNPNIMKTTDRERTP